MGLSWREAILYGSTYTMIWRYLPPNGGGISAPFTTAILVADLELGVVVQLRLGETLSADRHQAHRQTGGVELQHDWRQGSWRQALQVGQRQVGELGDIGVRAGSRLEVHLDDADAQQRADSEYSTPLASVKNRSS